MPLLNGAGLGGFSLLPGTRCSVVVSDNPLMLLSNGLRTFLAPDLPVGARVARRLADGRWEVVAPDDDLCVPKT